MSELRETELPGVGIRYDYTTKRGERLGIIVHRSGRRELLVYDDDDPDRCSRTVRLDADEARSIAETMGADRVTEGLASLQQSIQGLAIDWIEVEAGAEAAGRTLREAAIHTRTGVSIVALVRGDEAVPAPGAEAVLEPGTTVIAVGTARGLAAVSQLLQRP